MRVWCGEYRGCYVSVRAQGGETWSLQMPLVLVASYVLIESILSFAALEF